MSAVKELPILFKAEMVRSILDGRKAQTRRIAKKPEQVLRWLADKEMARYYAASTTVRELCPYGQIGDHLWVKETWTPDHADFYPHFPICYRADFGPEYDRENGKVFSSEQNAWFPFKWRPSIFMPRRVCRITLEITGVRVERLSDITNKDALAEGAGTLPNPCGYADTSHFACCKDYPHQPKDKFRDLWVKINGKDSWAANPWVWVIEFKRLC